MGNLRLPGPFAALARQPDPDGWGRLIALRLTSMRDRMAFALCAGLAATLLFKDVAGLGWIVLAALGVVGEQAYWRRCQARIAAGASPDMAVLAVVLFAIAANYSSLCLVFWRHMHERGDVLGATFLSAVIVSSVVTLRAAPALAAASALAPVSFLVVTPILFGDATTPADGLATVTGGVFLATFAFVVWTRLAESDRAERAAVDAAHAASAEAARAQAAKSAFLAGMSRDLRTPITMVLGAAAMLRRADLAPADRAAVEVMLESGDVLVAVLTDVLDAARVESGAARFALAPASPAQIAQGIVQIWRPRAQDKWLELFLDVDPSAQAMALVDAARIKQILFCLVSNAVRFTDHGGVRVHVSATTVADRRVLATWRVADTGPGIAPMRAEALLDGRGGAGGDGAGMSLARSRALARAMGGDISVESAPGDGAVFTLSLETDLVSDASAPAAAGPATTGAGTGLRVLVVDDHAVSRRFAISLLTELGASSSEASSGQEAIDLLAAARFDLILMDLNMPGVSGFDVVNALRTSGRPGADTPVIALTAAATPDDRERCIRAGMDGHVGKPVVAADLFSEIWRVLEPAGRRAA